MPALALLIVPQRQAHWITCSPAALSCGRSKYSIPFQVDCVPRKVFQSNSTSSPSSLKNSCSRATKSFRPIPFGATLMCMAEYLSSHEGCGTSHAASFFRGGLYEGTANHEPKRRVRRTNNADLESCSKNARPGYRLPRSL